MKQDSSLEAYNFSAIQKNSLILWKAKVSYRVDKALWKINSNFRF